MPRLLLAEVTGFNELVAKFGVLKKDARTMLRRAVGNGCDVILGAAQALCPVDEGRLRDSLGKKVASYRGGALVIGMVGPRKGPSFMFTRGPNAMPMQASRYAHMVELGTVKMAARPFLRPAADSTHDLIELAMVTSLWADLQAWAVSHP